MAFNNSGLFLVPAVVLVSLVIFSSLDGICCVLGPGTNSSQPPYPPVSPCSCSYALHPFMPPFLAVENENETCCWYGLKEPVPSAFQRYLHTHGGVCEASSAMPEPASLLNPQIFPQDCKEEEMIEGGGEDEQGKSVKPVGQLFDRVKSKVVANLTQPDATNTVAGINNGANSGANGAAKAMPVTPAQAQYSAALRALSEEDGDDRLRSHPGLIPPPKWGVLRVVFSIQVHHLSFEIMARPALLILSTVFGLGPLSSLQSFQLCGEK